MFEVYDNETGNSLFICNSRFGLNQCFKYLEKKGFSVSYTVIGQNCQLSADELKTVSRWSEQ